jgi:hypothetical protein
MFCCLTSKAGSCGIQKGISQIRHSSQCSTEDIAQGRHTCFVAKSSVSSNCRKIVALQKLHFSFIPEIRSEGRGHILHLHRSCTVPNGAWFEPPERVGFLRQVTKRSVDTIAKLPRNE